MTAAIPTLPVAVRPAVPWAAVAEADAALAEQIVARLNAAAAYGYPVDWIRSAASAAQAARAAAIEAQRNPEVAAEAARAAAMARETTIAAYNLNQEERAR